MRFINPASITFTMITEMVMQQAARCLYPIEPAADDMLAKIGWDVFRKQDILAIFERHATPKDQQFAPRLTNNLWVAIAYNYGEDEANRVHNELKTKYHNGIDREDFAALLDDDELVRTFYKPYDAERIQFSANYLEDPVPSYWYKVSCQNSSWGVTDLFGPEESIVDFTARRRLDEKRILTCGLAITDAHKGKFTIGFYTDWAKQVARQEKRLVHSDYLKQLCETSNDPLADMILARVERKTRNNAGGAVIVKAGAIRTQDIETRSGVAAIFEDAGENRHERGAIDGRRAPAPYIYGSRIK